MPQPYEVTTKDGPCMYEAYYVEVFSKLDAEKKDAITSWQCDYMASVAASGFVDIKQRHLLKHLI